MIDFTIWSGVIILVIGIIVNASAANQNTLVNILIYGVIIPLVILAVLFIRRGRIYGWRQAFETFPEFIESIRQFAVGAAMIPAYTLAAIFTRAPKPEPPPMLAAITPDTVAGNAMRRAGYVPTSSDPRLIDLAIQVSQARSNEAQEVRARNLPTDTKQLRPFAALEVPDDSDSVGKTLRFEVLDPQQVVRFAANGDKRLRAGENIVRIPKKFPAKTLGGGNTGGRWALQLRIGERVLAIHRFDLPVLGDSVGEYIHTDGEIDARLTAAFSEINEEKANISLDELLADSNREQQ